VQGSFFDSEQFEKMEFPFSDVAEPNVSAGRDGSLYSRKPVIAVPYVAVLGMAAVMGTFGNLIVIVTVAVKHLHSRRHQTQTTENDAGRAFIANLALSDLIVTAVINPLAIAGLCSLHLLLIS